MRDRSAALAIRHHARRLSHRARRVSAASDFLASTGHPAVKAIAPLFAVWDTYTDNYFPGGIQLKSLTRIYDELMVGLDHDQRDILKNYVYFANPDFAGPQPVDEDRDG